MYEYLFHPTVYVQSRKQNIHWHKKTTDFVWYVDDILILADNIEEIKRITANILK